MSKYNIIQIGSFDVENFGDLLFPIVLEYELKKRINIDNIYLFSPNGGSMPFYKRHVYSISDLDLFCRTHKVDGIVLGGGDIIRLDQNVTAAYQKKFFSSFSMWQYPILIAQKYNIPIIFNCPGVPFNLEPYKHIISSTLETCPYISVRDKESRKNLHSNPSKIKIVIDSINLIDRIYPKKDLELIFKKIKKQNHIEDKFIILQINIAQIENNDFINELILLINTINNSFNIQVVLSPIGYVHSDHIALQQIYTKISQKNAIIKEKMSPKSMLALFSHSSGFIGTSLHGLITSNIYHIPILAINISKYSKVKGYMQLCGLENRLVEETPKITSTFQKNFFSKTDYKKLNYELKKLSKHFDNIAKIIKERIVVDNPHQIINLLENFYDFSVIDNDTINQYNAIVNSGFWKTTESLRRFLSKLHNK